MSVEEHSLSRASVPGESSNGDLAQARDYGPEDLGLFHRLIDTQLTEEEVQRVRTPGLVLPRQREVLAIHWHPEWISLPLARERVAATFPQAGEMLLIPTQHNQLLTMGEYAGAEVDCFASGFNRKVQLLLHFRADRIAGAHSLKAMLEHTFLYRSSQLWEFIHSLTQPAFEDRLKEAAAETGANDEVVGLARFYTARLGKMLTDQEARVPQEMVKNKLLSDYIEAQRGRKPAPLLNRVLLLIRAVKQIVKRKFSNDHFYRVREVIEETRSLDGGVVIPHPEQFWPILLADYDVDGWEVWNPQSREYTDFLIMALGRQNQLRRPNRRSLLVFMGDDTHLSVKLKDPHTVEPAKRDREVGWQPAWEDVAIRKALSFSGMTRARFIAQYKERLG
jgi:hypothetical protein